MPGSVPTIFAGHSRGGGIADISTLYFGESFGYANVGTITFGQVSPFSSRLSVYLNNKRFPTAKFLFDGDVGGLAKDGKLIMTKEQSVKYEEFSRSGAFDGGEHSEGHMLSFCATKQPSATS